MIKSGNLSFTELANFLDRILEKEKATWSTSTYLDWAKEPKELRYEVYMFGKQYVPYYINVMLGLKIKYKYCYRNLSIIHQRLSQSGIRHPPG